MSQAEVAAPAPATVRRIDQGEIVGLLAPDGTHAWRGLPFAASTAGENRLVQYWTSFARDGVPSCDGAPEWPVYGTADGVSLRFDAVSDGGIELLPGGDDIDRVAADFADDPSLDRETRCRIVAEMRDWYFARPVRQQLEAATGCA